MMIRTAHSPFLLNVALKLKFSCTMYSFVIMISQQETKNVLQNAKKDRGITIDIKLNTNILIAHRCELFPYHDGCPYYHNHKEIMCKLFYDQSIFCHFSTYVHSFKASVT